MAVVVLWSKSVLGERPSQMGPPYESHFATGPDEVAP